MADDGKPDYTETRVDSRLAYDGQLLKLREDTVRLPDGNHFWSEVTEPLDLPRDAQGEVDIQGTMQMITTIIEGWVREHPEQWLWLHRRWR